jgi:hypothetical protein
VNQPTKLHIFFQRELASMSSRARLCNRLGMVKHSGVRTF